MAEPGLRLRGQEIKVVVLTDGSKVTELNSISNVSDEPEIAIQQDGFLGEIADRVDSIFHVHGGSFEMQVNTANWVLFRNAIISKAQRLTTTVFNVVRVDIFADGTSIIYTYSNVSFGSPPQNAGGRAEFVKVKLTFKCSEAPTQVSAFL